MAAHRTSDQDRAEGLPGSPWVVCREGLLHLLAPPECVWCCVPTRQAGGLCLACRKLLISDYYRCRKCAFPLPGVVPNESCSQCRAASWKFHRVLTLGPYRGRLREAVIRIKKARFEPLRQALARELASMAWQHFADQLDYNTRQSPPIVLPIPNHWRRAWSRKSPAAMSLAYTIAEATGWPLGKRVLRRVRPTAKQGLLSWSERRQNVRGAFVVDQPSLVARRHTFLVDDVLTSGATAGEAAQCLKRAGATSVTVLVVARGTGSRQSQPQPPPGGIGS